MTLRHLHPFNFPMAVLLTIGTSLALTSCAKRSSFGARSTSCTQFEGSDSMSPSECSNLVTQASRFSSEPSLNGGQLPQNSVVEAPSNSNGATSSQTNNNYFNFSNPAEGQLMLNQTANDFGLLNYCYSAILSRGKTLLNSGSSADYVFKGAGQELYRCYNEVIQSRAAQLQQYQSEQAARDYWNQVTQAIIAQQLRGNYSNIQVAPPPIPGRR